jgi:Arc/MetJ-type ribon-helix-helix transcriptional regulator
MKVKKLLEMPMELWAKIEEIRFSARFKTESEAMRYLLELGATAHDRAVRKSQRKPNKNS